MSKYIVFGFEFHYPEGGANDIISWLDDITMLRELNLMDKDENTVDYDQIQVINTASKKEYSIKFNLGNQDITILNNFIENTIKSESE